MFEATSEIYKNAIASYDNKGFIVNPAYDIIFFIATPLIGLLIVSYIFNLELLGTPIEVGLKDKIKPISGVLMGGLIYGHLFIVFFRSHANSNIFKLYPYRFTIVPVVLVALISISPFFAILVMLLANWWDVYHSSLQTFGLGRIYDRKAGNKNMDVGRRLDYFLNLLLYAGPIFAGWALMPHMKVFKEYEQISDESFIVKIPDLVFQNNSNITWVVFAIGIPFLIFYLYSYWRFYKAGYNISFQKIALFTGTAICSISAWGFNSFGQAFIIMNFFHAIQYFAMIWHFEKKNMQKIFGFAEMARGVFKTFVIFILIGTGAGHFLVTNMLDYESIFAVAMTVSIMHFWYDSFIWSVRRGQV